MNYQPMKHIGFSLHLDDKGVVQAREEPDPLASPPLAHGSLAMHREAERCMGWGDSALAKGPGREEHDRAYAEAAEWEEGAYAAIPAGRLRTRGIIAVSVVSLWKTAGQPEKSRQRARELAEDETLPEWARENLRELAAE